MKQQNNGHARIGLQLPTTQASHVDGLCMILVIYGRVRNPFHAKKVLALDTPLGVAPSSRNPIWILVHILKLGSRRPRSAVLMLPPCTEEYMYSKVLSCFRSLFCFTPSSRRDQWPKYPVRHLIGNDHKVAGRIFPPSVSAALHFLDLSNLLARIVLCSIASPLYTKGMHKQAPNNTPLLVSRAL